MIDQSVFKPKLRIFRQLDKSGLSEDFIATVGEAEGSIEYVDADRARDFGWTEEIMANTIAAVLVDDKGSIVARFDGPDGFKAAEKARTSARVVFDIDIPDADAETDDSDVPAGFADL